MKPCPRFYPRWVPLAFTFAFALGVAMPTARAQETSPVSEEPAQAPPSASDDVPPAPSAAAPSSAPAISSAPQQAQSATPASVAPQQAPSAAASDAEAAAIEAELSGNAGSDTDSELRLNLYGFADFNYQVPLTSTVLLPDQASFAVGKLNLYAASELGDAWRSLVEIRFMYLPNGDTPNGLNSQRTDTVVGDNTDFSRPIRWGAIAIERAWIEHTFHSLLTVRAGQWLTPYGIWNVDHGSPVIIGVRRPFVVGEVLLPERQTGIEAFGSIGFGPSQVGYHLTLSNGRGPVDAYQDFDNNKAVGGRLFYKRDADFGTVTFGVSAYRGKFTDGTRQFSLTGNNQVSSQINVSARYDELSLAADAKWEWGGLLLQGEAISNEVAYAEAHRPPAVSLPGGPPGFTPDHRRFGFYGLAGYRTALFGIMPFAGAEYYNPGVHTYTGPAYGVWGGINSRPTPRVVLKAQYTHGWFPRDYFRPLNLLDFQVAWSF